jgi:hypothetical protein
MLEVHQVLKRAKNLLYIAEITTLGPIIGNDHITTFFEALFLPIRWRDALF